MGYYVKIYPDNPQQSKLEEAAEILRKGGLVIFPTDTIYAIGASIKSQKALESLARFKRVKLKRSKFSLQLYDLSHISEFTKPFDTSTFKLLKRTLPGPFTYIMEANNYVGKVFDNKKNTIGIRVPDNNIPRELVKTLGNPIVSTTLHHEDEIIEYPTDAELIYEDYKNIVGCVIDGGAGGNIASTVVDLTVPEPVVIREGLGDFEQYQ